MKKNVREAFPMRIFFIGNSFTYFNDLPGMFRPLCQKTGKVLVDAAYQTAERFGFTETSIS